MHAQPPNDPIGVSAQINTDAQRLWDCTDITANFEL